MRVGKVQSGAHIEPIKSVKAGRPEKDNEKDKKLLDEAVKYEPSQDKKPVTYAKTGHVYDKTTINKLKKQSEEAYSY
ncbi:MAG TPA: hypothetical protein VFF25_00065, partial [Clostridia bacterium]|nr:hypothetical protein [Clostridia bacterium]